MDFVAVHFVGLKDNAFVDLNAVVVDADKIGPAEVGAAVADEGLADSIVIVVDIDHNREHFEDGIVETVLEGDLEDDWRTDFDRMGYFLDIGFEVQKMVLLVDPTMVLLRKDRYSCFELKRKIFYLRTNLEKINKKKDVDYTCFYRFYLRILSV